MSEAVKLGLPVAVHAENDELTRTKTGRPVVAELDAIQRALLFAGETKASLHIVHVSTGRGVALAAEARARDVDVSIETCPHYLWFTEDDIERLGTIAKCAPPLRSAHDARQLWDELLLGHVDIVASDHSPTEPALKARDFASAWGGIAGVQSTLPVLIDSGYHDHRLPLERIGSLLSATPARRFRIARKGAIVEGYDADLVLVDCDQAFTLRAEALQQRHKTSPYVGQTFRGVVKRTLRRGETIFADGHITARNGGRFVRPEPCRIGGVSRATS
jgi:allantoinase